MIVFLNVILCVIILILIIYFAKIEIDVKRLKYNTKKGMLNNFQVNTTLKIVILSKIPVFWIKVDNKILEKIYDKSKKKLNFKNEGILDRIYSISSNQNKLEKKDIKNIFEILNKMIQYAITKIAIKIEIGTENAAITSLVIPIIATVISVYFRNKVEKRENNKFNIKPIYINENFINVELQGIFKMKIRHIIYILYILNKHKGEKVYDRTSDRRSYGYSYE